VPVRTNLEIAAVFQEMAELLRLRGGDPHRARAFAQAGKTIENLPQPAAKMLELGSLQRLPKVGEGTIHRVKQILRSGTCDDLERLRRTLPAGLREIMEVKGLGARTVRTLWERFGIATLDQLEIAARGGGLVAIAGFSPERVHQLVHEIGVVRARRGRLPLADADLLVGRLLASVLERSKPTNVEAAGSIRRRIASIGDLDLIAAAEDVSAVVRAFVTVPGVREVLAQGDSAARVRLEDHRQADLWVVRPESWGACQHAYGGSAEHVVALRTRAGRLGLHVSEHGVADRASGRRLISGREEAEIFAAVGLPWIAPEIRESLGEIEAAAEGRLPRLVDVAALGGELHCHTTESDGSGSALDMARAAIDLGLEYLAITDHSPNLPITNGLSPTRLKAQGEQLRRLEDELGALHLLAGVEVDILADGSLDHSAAVLGRLDWVVASVHDHLDQDAEGMTLRVIRAIESGVVDCIGHPTGRRLGHRESSSIDLERVLEAARRVGVAVEINGHPGRMDLDEVGARQARELGVMVCIDTDAHSPAHLARREYGLAMARRAWLEPADVLNCSSVEVVRDRRRDRLRRHGVAVPRALDRLQSGRFTAATVEPPAARAAGPSSTVDLGPELPDLEGELSPELVERLQAFLQGTEAPDLAAALARLGGNPLQRAYELVVRQRQR
jgi:DNA polymerase (family 10)